MMLMNAAPPKIAPAKALPSNARFAMAVLALAALGVLAVVYFFNPSAHAFYPVCQFHRLTGLNCPGCGATRALYALLHGNSSTAMHDNLLLVAAIPATALRGFWFGLNRLRGRPNGRFFPNSLWIPLLIVMGLFGVLRNLPMFSFLSP
jgi:hypothetical protein